MIVRRILDAQDTIVAFTEPDAVEAAFREQEQKNLLTEAKKSLTEVLLWGVLPDSCSDEYKKGPIFHMEEIGAYAEEEYGAALSELLDASSEKYILDEIVSEWERVRSEKDYCSVTCSAWTEAASRVMKRLRSKYNKQRRTIAMTIKRIIDGQTIEIPITVDEANAIYLDRERSYLKEDAFQHLIEVLSEDIYDIDTDSCIDDFVPSEEAENYMEGIYGVKLSELLDEKSENYVLDKLVSLLDKRRDCDFDDNSTWDFVVREILEEI